MIENKIVAGIVLFNPNIKRLKLNIESIISQVEELILIDNLSNNLEEIKKILRHYDYNKITLIKNKKNLGIATALNQMMSVAEQKKYRWCLTLNQDSVVPTNMIKEYLAYISNHSSMKNKIGILCPTINNLNKSNKCTDCNTCENIDSCITSGSLTYIEAWKNVGKFDDKMFIDEVDHDFCFRLKQENYNIIQINSLIMSHELGDIKYKRIMGICFRSMNHSPFRKYYIARNIVYVDIKHFGKVNLKSYSRLLKQFIMILLVEEKRLDKVKMFIKGYCDGFSLLQGEL